MHDYCCRCSAATTTVMAYDYDTRELWIDDVGGSLSETTTYALCERHADRLTPPVGWVMFDLRRTVLELFSSREVA